MVKGIAIIGASGMARDALNVLDALGLADRVVGMFESDDIWQSREISGFPVLPFSAIEPGKVEALIAVGDPRQRASIRDRLPSEIHYPVFVHPSVVVGRKVELSKGTLVCAGSILTCDITIADHVQINIATSVTHDCVLGNFSTTAPGVRISGNCTIGAYAYLGTNCSVHQKIRIGEGVTVGMGSVVIRDLDAGGVYVGNPARRIR